MSTEPEPTIIWLSKDDFSRLKEDLHELFEGKKLNVISVNRRTSSRTYPESWDDVICDDGKTVQFKITYCQTVIRNKRIKFVFLRQRIEGRQDTYIEFYGELCGCTLLPTGE